MLGEEGGSLRGVVLKADGSSDLCGCQGLDGVNFGRLCVLGLPGQTPSLASCTGDRIRLES